MFITQKSSKSPFSELLGGASHEHWNEVELALQSTWFVVALRQVESNSGGAIEIARTLLLSSVREVEKIAEQTVDGPTRLVSIHVVTPGFVNGSDEWKMNQLRAIWSAEDPKEPGQRVEIFETNDGAKYTNSAFGSAIDDLKIKAIRFRSPADDKY